MHYLYNIHLEIRRLNIIIKNTLKTGINKIKTAYLNEITSFFLQCKYNVLYVHGYNYKTKVFHSVHVRDVSTPKLHGEEWTSTVKASSKGVCDSFHCFHINMWSFPFYFSLLASWVTRTQVKSYFRGTRRSSPVR